MASRRWKSFLVAVRDIDHPPRALLTKATRIAKQFGGRLELLHVIAQPYVLPGGNLTIEQTKQSEIERLQKKLARTAARLAKIDVKVTAKVIWDYPAADAIVRHVMSSKPDVVIAESHHHNKVARWFVTHTDWELIRACPCPLWLVKTSKLAPTVRALAAIDPFHTHSKPAALDEEVLRAGAIVASDKGRLGAVHIYTLPVTMVAGGMGEPVWVPVSAAELKRARQHALEAVNDSADRYDIKKPDRLLEAGDPALELPALTKKWKTTLLVMGAVSRSALRRVFIGHTAERVIDAVHCDVLVVKPRSFKSPVGKRPNATVIPVPPI